MSVRHRRLILRLAYLLIGAVLLAASTSSAAHTAGYLILFIILSFCCPRLVVGVEILLFRFARCRACGAYFDLVDRWRCSCGYVPSTHRHLFRVCPRCRSRVPYVKCPRCTISVDI